jgi:hypothetical protein
MPPEFPDVFAADADEAAVDSIAIAAIMIPPAACGNGLRAGICGPEGAGLQQAYDREGADAHRAVAERPT